MIIKFKKTNEKAVLPEYSTSGAAGMDLRSIDTVVIPSMESRIIDTGWIMEIPPGYEVQIRSRSGLAAKHNLFVTNSPGTVDSDYRGSVKVMLFNLGKEPFNVHKGDRIAQMVMNKIELVQVVEVEELTDTDRGQGGLGSTGII